MTFESIKNSDKILKLLQLITFQIRRKASHNELSSQLGLSRNPRKEVAKNSKWYFYDNGIRNALIAKLNPISLRNDIGQLWENYVISERMIIQYYNNMLVYNYFWRTYDQQKIDWIEDRGGKLYAYEFKWSEKKRSKMQTAWKMAYKDAEFKVINPLNYLDWLN